MATEERNIKNFIQEILRTEGLVAADQLSILAVEVFGEVGTAFYINEDKKEELNRLLQELNQEIHATREAHELGKARVSGYQSLIKPFSNLFYYLSENIHEKRAKNLAFEAAQLFLQESVSGLLESTITAGNIRKIKDITVDAISAYREKSTGLASAYLNEIKNVKGKIEDIKEKTLSGDSNKQSSELSEKLEPKENSSKESSEDTSTESKRFTSPDKHNSKQNKKKTNGKAAPTKNKENHQNDNKDVNSSSSKKKLESA
jgi:hypothetical protein